MATQEIKVLEEGVPSKHPTNRIKLEIFRTAIDEAKADVNLATEKMKAFKRVLYLAEVRLQWAQTAYENALAIQGKRRKNDRYVKRVKPVEEPVMPPPAEPPRCNGSMVAMLLGC